MADDFSWAWEKTLEPDDQGRERKQACVSIVECPECGKDVELVAETDAWVQAEDGRWMHAGFSLPTGVCCDLLIVDGWEECEVFDLGNRKEATTHG